MRASLLEWFREDGTWTIPEGRRGEFVVLVVGLPAFAWYVHVDSGLPWIGNYWLFGLLGVVSGSLYASSYRERVVDSVPVISGWTLVSMFAGGFGLTILELVHVADPAVSFLLAAGGTVVAVYVVRLLSPVHRGIQPPRRGVEPPPALGVEG